MPDAVARKFRRGYYAAVSQTDHNFGVVRFGFFWLISPLFRLVVLSRLSLCVVSGSGGASVGACIRGYPGEGSARPISSPPEVNSLSPGG